MIVKNGEILAIDHIAHDNTLSGNGTSAKPVGLSQSTKDLIDSKVKKTDFETYKSSAANQISNINTKITADESNFESYKSSAANQINNINNKIAADEADFNSYKSSAHNEIARIDGSIAAVNAAKVDKTTFTQYQTDVANNFTAVNKRIDDVDAAKQNKGDYVSASNFESYKSSAHNEIARVDGRIDATNTNLENNYYDITETYNRTEVDEKFANFGGFKFRDPDPTKNNEPKLKPGEVEDPKAIYLTQPAGATQYLQWIWNTEVTPNVWKCIGDTTMDLSDYAKTVDVVASANANKTEVKNWTDDKFETKQDFESVIAGYYTKSEVNTELATKVNNTDFNAYKTEVAGKFTNTSAWANETFATKQNLTDTKAELEDTIESVSGEIISKVNTDYGTLDGKIDAIVNTLSNDYYTSLEIDAILAASGEYYTKSESDTKYTEKTVFNTAINELNSNKLDKSATANWDVTEYTEGENIKIVGHEISGKDWSNEIADAVENKVDESELENYYTSSQIDGNFVTKTEFNKLDNEVGAIDADLDTLSGKTVTVIKDSETVKAIRSTEPDGTISYTLSAHDGKQADYLWKPTVNAAGDISWELALTGDTPDPANIKGPQGIQGISGTPGKNGENGITPKLKIDENDIWNVSYDNEETWTSLGVSATGPKGETGAQGPRGISGTPGKNGENGITPHIGNNNHWFIGDDDTGVSATGPQGPQGEEGHDGDPGFSPTVNAVAITDGEKTGTEITFTYKDAQGQIQTTVYSAWNGVNGEGATVHFDGIDGIKITPVDTTHFNVGLSADYKTQVEDVSGKQDALTQAQLDYIDAVPVLSAASASWNDKLNASTFNTYTATTAPDAFQAKGNYLSANALNGYATESWVEGKHYLVANDIAGKADKTDLQYVSAGVDYVSGNIPTKVTDLTDSADYAKKTDLEGFVTRDGITTQGADYVMTTTGWKVLSLPGGGMTAVIHDTTLTGLGNADNDKLGVAWSALSGNTIASALSAGSATVAANLGTSSFADITGAINAKADATAISDMLTKTVAEETYQTIAGMSDYLTTAQYATNSAKYVTSGNEISAANEQYALTTTGWTKIVTPATFTGVTVTGSISGGGVNNDTIGLLTSAENALTDVANKVAKPDTTQTELNNNYLIYSTLTGTGTTTGWMPLSANYYSKSEADGRYQKKEDMSSYLTTAQYETDSAKYVSTGDILTAANNKLTGIKIGSTSYAVPTTDLSNYYTKSETSATSELNTEFAKKLDSTIAASTYQTIDDMSAYLPLTGGTVTGQLTISGNNFNNNLDLKRGNYEGFIGLANNGAITFKNNANGSTSQIEFLTSASKTFDITVKDNSSTPQSVGKLYVMSAHSLADAAATSANWANDGMLHIILES